MTETKDLSTTVPSQSRELSAFSSLANFEVAQRMANALSNSDLVPTQFKGKVANCLVALEVAQRCQASPLMVMQNLNIIHGRPSWSATYIIAAINSSGRFAPLKFKIEGQGDQQSCAAWTTDKAGNVIEGPAVTIAMAKAEGWFDKNGSKWKTMPELMLRYRSASFFGRLYAPEILMGMRTDDEEREIIDVNSTAENSSGAAEKLNQKIKAAKKTAAAAKEPIVEPAPAPASVMEPTVIHEGDHF